MRQTSCCAKFIFREFRRAGRARSPRQRHMREVVLHAQSNVVAVRAQAFEPRHPPDQPANFLGYYVQRRHRQVREDGELLHGRMDRPLVCGGPRPSDVCRYDPLAVKVEVGEALHNVEEGVKNASSMMESLRARDFSFANEPGQIVSSPMSQPKREAFDVWAVIVDGRQTHAFEVFDRQVRQ
ncbi:hypothetical protein MRX96_058416 [Rhipicephalus microplus]